LYWHPDVALNPARLPGFQRQHHLKSRGLSAAGQQPTPPSYTGDPPTSRAESEIPADSGGTSAAAQIQAVRSLRVSVGSRLARCYPLNRLVAPRYEKDAILLTWHFTFSFDKTSVS
jgi:hypothetical protein